MKKLTLAVLGLSVAAISAPAFAQDALPIGLAHNMVLKTDVPAGRAVRWSDVAYDAGQEAIRVRREMEDLFRGATGRPAG